MNAQAAGPAEAGQQAQPADTEAGTNVLIIGGGVIGLAIAWRAAQRGLRVTVADPAPGQGATHAAAGMLTPVAEAAYAERELFALGSASLERYPAFTAELTAATGLPTGFRLTGTLQVAYDADDWAALLRLAELQETLGRPVRRLTARECRETEPMLAPSVRGGLLVAGDGSVDPRLLAEALLAAAQRAGVRIIRQRAAEILTAARTAHGLADAAAPATGAEDAAAAAAQGVANGVAGARLADGSVVRASQVVLAAGWQSASLAGLPAGAVPPVRPVKGQILRLRPGAASRAAGLPDRLITTTVRGVVRGSSVYLVPREDGELVVGATQEERGADMTVTAGGVWELLRDARLIVPGITELELAESVAGLRPGTPDNAPVIGRSSLPGLVLATGHFRSGVLLAPVTADVVAEYLVTGELPALAQPFAARRFGDAPAVPPQDAVPPQEARTGSWT
jgi:glycine oxidase